MGTTYVVKTGYGFIVPQETVEAWHEDHEDGDDDPYYEDYIEYLWELQEKYPLLEVDSFGYAGYGGDENDHVVFIKSTVKSYYDLGAHQFIDAIFAVASIDDKKQLEAMKDELGASATSMRIIGNYAG